MKIYTINPLFPLCNKKIDHVHRDPKEGIILIAATWRNKQTKKKEIHLTSSLHQVYGTGDQTP